MRIHSPISSFTSSKQCKNPLLSAHGVAFWIYSIRQATDLRHFSETYSPLFKVVHIFKVCARTFISSFIRVSPLLSRILLPPTPKSQIVQPYGQFQRTSILNCFFPLLYNLVPPTEKGLWICFVTIRSEEHT